MTLDGRFVRCMVGDELIFSWDAETYAEQQDADAQEQPRGSAHGAVGVDALYNPKRISLAGMYMVEVGAWAALTAFRLGQVISASGRFYQCTTAGTSGETAPAWPETGTVTDGTAVWTVRASRYECLRGLKDEFDRFFHAGILKIYLDSDRYIFGQCVSRSFSPWDGNENALSWDATFSCFDPRWIDSTLVDETVTVTGTVALWEAGEDYAAAAPIVFPGDNAHKYKAQSAGMSGPSEPGTPYTATAWTAEAVIEEGDVIRPTTANGYVYEATTVAGDGETGTTEPDWGTTPDATTVDNDITWTCRDEFSDSNTEKWESTREYLLDDVVIPSVPSGWMYVCTRAGESGSTEPTWPETEDATVDDPDGSGAQWTAHEAVVWEPDGASGAQSETVTLTYNGTASSEPVITLTVPACRLGVTIENLDTAEECTLTGDTEAGDLVVDCMYGLVTLDDVDATELFDGVFPTLVPGQNRIQVTWNEPGPSAILVEYRERYW